MPSDAVQFITACPNDRFWLSKDKGIDKLRPLQVHNGSWIADTLQFLCLPYSLHVIIFVLRLQRYYEAVPNSGMADKKRNFVPEFILYKR